MSDPLAMALDDVIKQKKGGKGGRGGGKGAGGRGGGRGGKGGRGGRGGGRGGRNDRGGERRKAGGVQRQRRNRTNRSSPYSKGDPNSEWSHDLYAEKNGSGDRKQGRGGRGARATRRKTETGRKIIIDNLGYEVLSEDIKDLFGSVGKVERAKVQFDRSGRSKGSAVVVFSNEDDVHAAIEKFNNVELDHQPMHIRVATDEPKKRTTTSVAGGFVITPGEGGRAVITRNN